MNNLINLIKKEYDTPVSDNMISNIEEWEDMYCDNPHWECESILGTPQTICQTLSSQILTEAKIEVTGESEKAIFVREQIEKHLLPRLKEQLEKGMAVGGIVFRPYISNGGINIDFCRQGQFLILAFDDDGNVTDIAFGEQIQNGKVTYTRVERQTLDGDNVIIENKAYKGKGRNLGKEIPLSTVDKWADIDPKVVQEGIEGTCFGYYRTPLANNIDIDSPVGISIFSPAKALIKKVDEQFDRLDWEYEGGQLAVDVSEDAILPQSELTDQIKVEQTKKRLYHKMDFQDIDTWKAYNPSLRDSNYNDGLDNYLMRIEDKIGMERGALSKVDSVARTATEIITLKERRYHTLVDNQEALENALQDMFKAVSYLAEKYYDVEGGCKLVINWNDSILEDYQTELDRHQQRIDMGIEDKIEARMWAFGEDRKDAEKALENMDALTDIYNDLENMGEPVEPIGVE